MGAEEIVQAFGASESVALSALPDISLAVVQQIAGGYCTTPTTEPPAKEGPTDFESMTHLLRI